MIFRAACLALCLSIAAQAHAVVQPAQSTASESQRYTLRVPNEKDVPTLSVTLSFPVALDVTAVDELAGWKLSLTRNSSGKISAATWTGTLAPTQSAQFTFTAKNPSAPATLIWNTKQLYAGDLLVEWTGEPGSRTPASRTEITAK